MKKLLLVLFVLISINSIAQEHKNLFMNIDVGIPIYFDDGINGTFVFNYKAGAYINNEVSIIFGVEGSIFSMENPLYTYSGNGTYNSVYAGVGFEDPIGEKFFLRGEYLLGMSLVEYPSQYETAFLTVYERGMGFRTGILSSLGFYLNEAQTIGLTAQLGIQYAVFNSDYYIYDNLTSTLLINGSISDGYFISTLSLGFFVKL